MNRRTLTSLLLLLVSVVFLIYSWFILKDDTERSCTDRVNSYNYFLELHRDGTLNAFNQAATALSIEFSNDDDFLRLIPQDFSYVTRAFKIPWDTISKNYPMMKDVLSAVGFSSLEILSDPGFSDTLFSGFTLEKETAVYRIVRPIKNEELQTNCSIVFYFDQNQFYLDRNVKFLGHINLGYLLLSENFRPVPAKYTKEAPFCKGKAFVPIDFTFPQQLFKREQFVNAVNDGMERIHQSNVDVAFSISERIRSDIYVISVIKIPCSEPLASAYLLSVTKDSLLDMLLAWRYVLLAINGFLVAFVVFGLFSLRRSLDAIEKQKALVQESEQRLREINLSKDKFYSIIAHDLKNPFNGIMGLSDYLCTSYDKVDDQEILEILKEINLASRNSYNLLQNLLEWTRSQMGVLRKNPVRLELNAVINLALETVWNIARNKNISISVKIETQKDGYADQNMVATIIRNMVTNAIKYSQRGKKVELMASLFKDDIVFRVKDEGIGLSSLEIDKLFRIDSNFHKQGTEQERGSGLGLKLCDEFARQCGGRIWVVSTVSEGSSFYFTIPIYVDQDKQPNL